MVTSLIRIYKQVVSVHFPSKQFIALNFPFLGDTQREERKKCSPENTGNLITFD